MADAGVAGKLRRSQNQSFSTRFSSTIYGWRGRCNSALAMRIKSLLLTFGILGSSSVALADHDTNAWQRRTPASYRQPTYRPPVYQPNDQSSYRPQRPYTTWQPLTNIERLERGGDVFDVRGYQRFSQLRLQNQTGRTYVRQIEIVFTNGERRVVRVNRALEGNHAMINIDLQGDGRRIDRIFVDGRSARSGSYQLYGM